jgi:cytochrome P450 family 3 subfamily A
LEYVGRAAKDTESDLVTRYGKTVGLYEGITPFLLLSDPEIIKMVLVKNFSSFTENYQFHYDNVLKKMVIQSSDNEWRKTRSIITPTFTSGKMKAMLPIVQDSIVLLEKSIYKHIKSGKEMMDAKHLFTCLTLDVIAKVAFAADVNTYENENDEFVEHAKKLLYITRSRFMTGFLCSNWIKSLTKFTLFVPDHRDYLLNMCRAMLEQKKKAGNNNKKFTDFGQLLLEARNEKGEALDDDEIVANSFLILIAGFETTATLMTMVSWVLSTHPEAQEKLYQEVTECYKSNGNQFEYDTVWALPYLDAFLQETLRMYPPVVRFDRVASQDVTLDNGLNIKKGTHIRFPAYTIQRSPEYWKNPDEFVPERFLPENKDELVPYTFMPFVLGPRNCIGARFALMEAKHATANIVMKFKFGQNSPNPEPLDFSEGSFMLSPRDVFVKVEERVL